ncbi:MAG: 4-hydroxy-tetrahydrodipicolinate reductase [Clostridiales bacterium]|jgi:4-hydroxy-tetrahydrodipicolinate reductase|nr:4-hydroxy-tetrahydrodipicolinate reductase [Clostridiales bacterium]
MTDIFIFGLCGKMGNMLKDVCAKSGDYRVTGGFDLKKDPEIPTFGDVDAVNVPFDVIIDFSRPETLPRIRGLAVRTARPVVLATTGYDGERLAQIRELAKSVPVFLSGNMSLGISVLLSLVSRAAKALSDKFDVEIIEAHHNQKSDAPSGTAKMIADSVAESLDYTPEFVYGRNGANAKRKPAEIGVHSVRGGSVVGEHTVMFCGPDEVLTISHSAASRSVFALGALKAADFIKSKPPGLYTMKDLTER